MNFKRSCQWLQVLAATVLLVAWLLPIHFSPWAVAYQEFLVFLSAFLFFSTMLLSGEVRVSPALLGFLLLPVIPIFQLNFGIIYFSGDAWLVSFYLLGFALMLQVGYNSMVNPVSKEYFIRLLAVVLVIGAVLSTWVALRQWLITAGSADTALWVADLPPGVRPFANIGQPNNLATLLCMGLAGVLYFYEKRLLGSIAAGLLAGFILFAVALTQSRAPWLAVIAAIFIWWLKAGVYAPRLSMRGLLMWLGVYALYVIAIELLSGASSSIARSGSVNERMAIYAQLWQNIWDGPIWGYGWTQVGSAQLLNAANHAMPSISLNGHNILLDLMIWNGPILGGFISLAIFFWLVRITFSVRGMESIFALLAAAFVLTHSIVEFPYEYAYLLFPLGLLLGAAAGGSRAGVEIVLPRRLLAFLLFILIFVFGWYWREYKQIEEDYRLLRLELARVGTIKAEQSAPDVVLLTQLREFIRFARTPPSSNLTQSELDGMRLVLYRYPSYTGLLRYMHALVLNGQLELARDYFELYMHIFGPGQRLSAQAMFELNNMRDQYPDLFKALSEGGK